MLVPAPAFALMFLGSWSFFQSTPGIATIFPPVDSPNHYILKIGMGHIPPPTVNKLTVTATRDFIINGPSQLVSIRHMFGSFLLNSSIDVTLSVQRFNVPNDAFNFVPYSFTANGTANPSLDYSQNGNLQSGLYRLSVTITYTCRILGNCAWNNSSPHTFFFDGH
jgi:hypothetical protein